MDEDVAVTVTNLMAVYALDVLPKPIGEDEERVYRTLKLKLFGLWVGKADAALSLARDELWMLEAIAKSAAAMGKEAVGLKWLAVCAEGLLHLEAEAEVHEAVAQIGEREGEDADGSQEVRGRLVEWGASQGKAPEREYPDG